MKNYTKFLYVLLMSVLLISCNRELPENPVEISITEQEVEQAIGLEVGVILEVALPAAPSTGYRWEVGFCNPSVLKPVGEPEFIQQSTNLGSEEVQNLHFEAVGEGETELVLVYRRSFEKEEIDPKIFRVTVVVQ
jgi:predicted secreted protein